jgi:hypothetical protein
LREVAFEECPTGITELSDRRATSQGLEGRLCVEMLPPRTYGKAVLPHAVLGCGGGVDHTSTSFTFTDQPLL